MFRQRTLVGLVLTLVLATGACVDEPGATLLAPDDAVLREAGHGVAPAPVRFMTRNLYLGGSIDGVLAGIPGAAEAAWMEIQYTSFPERAGVLAREILERTPHLVGLQEVTRYVVTHAPSGAPLGTIDFLGILMLHLGSEYRVVDAASNLTATVTLGDLEITYTDGDAVLAHRDVDVHDFDSEHFDLENQAFLGPFGYNLRGYQWADVTVEGQRLLFVNTHLEIQLFADVQQRQAKELLEFVAGRDGPIFMTGDFNSAANPGAPDASKTATYGMILDAGFDDLWSRGGGRFSDDGLTCCHRSDLSNPEPTLNQRIDFLFARNVPSPNGGYAGGAAVEVVGEEPDDRFSTAAGYDLWPSDHAGVFGEVWMPARLLARR